MTLLAKITLAVALLLSIAIPFGAFAAGEKTKGRYKTCLLYTSPSPRDLSTSRMPSSA